ncbi:MTFP1 family protein [Megaselia abdita]
MSAEEKNMYRDTFLRYFGYAHHVASYASTNLRYVCSGITASYIFTDLMLNVNKISKPKEPPKKTRKHSSRSESEDQESKLVIESIDVLLWQGLASLLIPSLISKRINSLVDKELSKKCSWRKYRKPVSSTLAFLAIIAASKPVDLLTSELLNKTYRPIFKESEKKEPPK